MAKKQQSRFSRHAPLVFQVLIWALVASLVLASRWPQKSPELERHFYLAGNRTNLFAVLAVNSKDATASGAAVLSRMDARGSWLDPEPLGGRVLQVLAWQEDLVAMFADGGFYFLGPSKLGYQLPPLKGAGAWRPLAAAAEGSRLWALGLDVQGRALVCERTAAGWGEVQQVALKADWTAETAESARAAMRGGELHVVWVGPPVSETPLGGGTPIRWLRFAWRDERGNWHGPEDAKGIHPDGPLCLAPFGEKLALVYREAAEVVPAPAGSQSAAAQGGATGVSGPAPGTAPAPAPPVEARTGDGDRLAYAEFTPGDRQWHRVRELSLKLDEAGRQRLEDYGFAQFRDGHALAARYDTGAVAAMSLEADTGRLTALPEVPRLAVRGLPGEKSDEGLPSAWFWAIVVAMAVMFLLLQAAQRKALRDRLEASEHPEQEAAKIMARQYERMMYLPVLVRRIGAIVLDLFLLVVAAAVVLGLVWPQRKDAPWSELGNFSNAMNPDLSSPLYWALTGLLVALMVVYCTVTELVWQRTLGKLIFGLRVVDVSGRRPVWWRIVVRNLIRPVDVLLLYGLVGLLTVLWTPRNQRLGDLAAGTRVVRDERTSGAPQDGDRRAT